MVVHRALAAAATLVSLAFTLNLAERWWRGRRLHQALWAMALGMFVVASAALWVGAAFGWTQPAFRVFYLFGAVLNVPFLAAGSVALAARESVGRRVAIVVAVVGAFAAGVVTVSRFTHPFATDHLPQGSHVFGALPRVFAAVGSGGGALVIIGLAVWSAFKHRYVLGNSLIALGTLLLGLSGVLNSVLDAMTGFAVMLVVGVTVLFAGFLVTTRDTVTSGEPASSAGGEALSR